jgi:transposase
MNTTIVAAARALDALQIHLAACRYRRQGLACSTCSDVAMRAARFAARVQVAA